MNGGERLAQFGERCVCGRPAVTVFSTDRWGEVGWCGLADGGRRGRCVFCGDPDVHGGERCPHYVLRPDPPTAESGAG